MSTDNRSTKSPPRASRGDPPPLDIETDGPEVTYSDLFGKPALSPTRAAVFFGVYELAVKRLMTAEDAVDAARSEFYRGDHPFDYQISESAETVGGENR